MKKKRHETKRNSGSKSSNANNGSNIGSSDAKNSSAKNGNIKPNDKHHSRSTPCSNLVADIAREIFPSVAALPSCSSVDGAGNDGCGTDGKSIVENGGRKSSNKKSKDEAPAATENGSSSIQQREEEQPLLGYMIQKYLLEERKQARSTAAGGSCGNAAAPTTSSSKKKKNKKKKKKKASSAAIGASSSTDHDESANSNIMVGGEQTGESDCQAAAAAAEAQKQPSGGDDLDAYKEFFHRQMDDLDRRGIQAELFNDCGGLPSLKCQAQDEIIGLDNLLDSLIDSDKASGGTMSNDSRITGMENRHLEAFSAFLSRKLEVHLEGKKQQQHQSQQTKQKDKSKASSSPRQTENGKSSPQPCNINAGLEYKDVLPTISINEAQDLSNSADCRKCRTSATSHLRSLTREEQILFSMDGNIEIQHQTVREDPVIILNEGSARIPSLSKTSSDVAAPAAASEKGLTWDDFGRGDNNSGLTIPVTGISMFGYEDCDDSAFDYWSMDMVDLEAGGCGAKEVVDADLGRKTEDDKNVRSMTPTPKITTANSSQFQLELRPISQASEKVRYLQIGTAAQNENEEMLHSYPMTTKDIINLVKNILLPCGLEQSALPPEGAEEDINAKSCNSLPTLGSSLSDEDLAQIAVIAKNSVSSIQSDFLKAKMSIFGMKEQMDKAGEQNYRSHFDPKTTKILNECDGQCEDLFKMIGRLLLKVFKMACFVGWSRSERGRAVLLFAHSMWERYNTALESLVEPVLEHRGKLLSVGFRKNEVPQAFKVKAVRDSLYKLVQTKISTLNVMVEDVSAIINESRNNRVGGIKKGGPSWAIELCMFNAYRRHVEGMAEDEECGVFSDSESEELMNQLIVARMNLSQRTISTGSVDSLMAKAKEQKDEISSICKKVRKIVIAIEDFVPDSQIEFLSMGYKKYEDAWYEIDKMQKSNVASGNMSKSQEEASEVSALLKKSLVLSTMWMIQLCARQCNESPMGALFLPSKLEMWLDCVSCTEAPNLTPGELYDRQCAKKAECAGEGGERRVSSILAALIYRWLEARCSEWHAELTRDEILKSMDLEVQAQPVLSVESKGGKSGKKKKSKRKSGGGGGNKGKKAVDEAKNDSQIPSAAQESSINAADKKPVVDNNDGDITKGYGQEYQEGAEIAEDEKKDDPVEIEKDRESSPTAEAEAEAESIKLAQYLTKMEEAEVYGEVEESRPEEEWKETKKSKPKPDGVKKAETLVGDDKEHHFSHNHRMKPNSKKKPNAGKSQEKAPDIPKTKKKNDTTQPNARNGNQSAKLVDNGNGEGIRSKAEGADIESKREQPLPEATDGANTQSPSSQEEELPEQAGLEHLQEVGSGATDTDTAGYENFESNVGIIDGKEFVPAELYLVNRLQGIAALKGAKNSPRSAKNIVWM